MMQNTTLHTYIPLDEDRDLDTQLDCQDALDALLNRLCSMVAHSNIRGSEKSDLIAGIAHLRSHIYSETAFLCAEARQRRN